MDYGNKGMAEQQLVYRLSQGDEKAFEELYRLFSKKIYHTARQMNLCHEDAEGTVQEVFLKIWKNRTGLDPSLSINAYLITIVRSLVIKKAKKEARFFAYQKYNIPLHPDITNGTEDDLIYADLHQISSEMIHQLPAGQKKVFIMRNIEYLSVDEIAEKLQVSKRTVENQIFRATKNIKAKLLQMKIISLGAILLLHF
jgi:RNA polymerase sigma-70 factor (ECF subfamily)